MSGCIGRKLLPRLASSVSTSASGMANSLSMMSLIRFSSPGTKEPGNDPFWIRQQLDRQSSHMHRH